MGTASNRTTPSTVFAPVIPRDNGRCAGIEYDIDWNGTQSATCHGQFRLLPRTPYSLTIRRSIHQQLFTECRDLLVGVRRIIRDQRIATDFSSGLGAVYTVCLTAADASGCSNKICFHAQVSICSWSTYRTPSPRTATVSTMTSCPSSTSLGWSITSSWSSTAGEQILRHGPARQAFEQWL